MPPSQDPKEEQKRAERASQDPKDGRIPTLVCSLPTQGDTLTPYMPPFQPYLRVLFPGWEPRGAHGGYYGPGVYTAGLTDVQVCHRCCAE